MEKLQMCLRRKNSNPDMFSAPVNLRACRTHRVCAQGGRGGGWRKMGAGVADALHGLYRGLITITEDYKIKLSSVLTDCKHDEAIEKFFMPYDNHSIFLPKKFLPDKHFLRYHYENIFLKKSII